MERKFKVMMGSCLFLASSYSTAKPWKSGEILSREVFRYGAFEARIKASSGSGAISSFYLLKEGSWEPGQEWQEIDFELFGKDDAKTFQSQIMTPGDPRTQNNIFHELEQPLSKDFHVYKMEWTPTEIKFYFDGKLIRTETDAKDYAKFFDPRRVEDMRLRLSLWVGFSEWSGQIDKSDLPSTLLVDWVKYQSYDVDTKKFTPAWQDDFDSFDSSRWDTANWTFEYAVNDFIPERVKVQDGQLKIEFTAE